MYYIFITVSALLFALGFLCNSRYEKIKGHTFHAALLFNLYVSFFGFILLLMIHRFTLHVSLFSLSVAAVYGLVSLLLNYYTVMAFQYANLSVFSVFSMIGGMLLPFLYGIILGEPCSIFKVLCCILIAGSVALTISEHTVTGKAAFYYCMVFFLNGSVGVLSKFHQIHADKAIDSGSFLMLTEATVLLLSTLLLLFEKKNRKDGFILKKEALSCCFSFAFLNKIGNLLLLIALLHIPASVQYPAVTGGVIVFSVLLDLIQKNKVTGRERISAAVALISSVLIAF